MGKIRVKTLGAAEEKKQKEEAKKRQETKKAQEQQEKTSEKQGDKKSEEEKKEIKTSPKTKSSHEERRKKTHSHGYLNVAKLVDENKKYSLKEALSLLPKLKRAKFDETVELHINTLEKSVSGSTTLPNGTGKKIRIEIVNPSDDSKHVDELVTRIESGNIDFDVLIATPDAMSRLAKVARFLGPRGLMPNPKNGTVTPNPKEVAKKYEGGQITFKTEAKSPIIHLAVGKVSFGEKKLEENIKTILEAIQSKNIKNVTLKSTMSPGIDLDISSL